MLGTEANRTGGKDEWGSQHSEREDLALTMLQDFLENDSGKQKIKSIAYISLFRFLDESPGEKMVGTGKKQMVYSDFRL